MRDKFYRVRWFTDATSTEGAGFSTLAEAKEHAKNRLAVQHARHDVTAVEISDVEGFTYYRFEAAPSRRAQSSRFWLR